MLSGPIAVARRDALIFTRLWRGIVFSGFLSPLLHLGAMGVGLGGMVRDDEGLLGGLEYLEFVAPGLMVASIVQLVAADSLWPVMVGTKWWRTYHAMVATPILPSEIAVGHILWQSARAAMTGTVFLGVAWALGGVASPWGVLAVPAAMLCAVAVSAPTCAFAAAQDSDAPFALVMRIGILPMFLFSGVFFPVDELPAVAAFFAKLLPLYHGVELARAAMIGEWAAEVVSHAAVLLAYLSVGLVIASRTFSKKLGT